jgi:hypothetical protein
MTLFRCCYGVKGHMLSSCVACYDTCLLLLLLLVLLLRAAVLTGSCPVLAAA